MSDRCAIDDCRRIVAARGWCIMHYKRWWKTGDPLGVKPPRNNEKCMPWIKQHLKFDGKECLKWPFNTDPRNGYAQMTIKRRTVNPARVICEMVHGPQPTPKHEIAHSCGGGHCGCVNPQHIRWATHRENEADKRLHGTDPAGVRHGSAKLSEEDVRKIRASVGTSSTIVAAQFGISFGHVCGIRRRKSWKHLP